MEEKLVDESSLDPHGGQMPIHCAHRHWALAVSDVYCAPVSACTVHTKLVMCSSTPQCDMSPVTLDLHHSLAAPQFRCGQTNLHLGNWNTKWDLHIRNLIFAPKKSINITCLLWCTGMQPVYTRTRMAAKTDGKMALWLTIF